MALTVFAARGYWIHHGAAQVPVWDQWIALFGKIYEPLVRGAPLPHVLAAPHNEHHILLPRLVSMLLYLLSGYWDLKGELVASAAARGVEMAVVVLLLRPLLSRGRLPGLVVVVLAAGALPLSPFNLESGLQVAFPLAETFSIIALALVARPLDVPRLAALVLCVLLAFFSMATGILAMAAAAATLLLQGLAGRSFDRARAAVVGLLSGLAVLTLALTPRFAGYGPRSAEESLRILVRAVAFPFPAHLVGAAASLLPIVLLTVRLVRSHDPGHPAWRVVALATWTLMQSVGLALGRGATTAPAEQHLELLALPLIWNYAALALLVDARNGPEPSRGILRLCPSLWAFSAVVFLSVHALVYAVPRLRAMEAARPFLEARFRQSLATGLFRREYGEMLVAEAQIRSGNAAFLYDPIGRHTVPRSAIVSLLSRERPVAGVFPPLLSGRGRPAPFARVLDGAAAAWPVFMAAGAALLVLGLRVRGARPLPP
jgi:hypothetical protein